MTRLWHCPRACSYTTQDIRGGDGAGTQSRAEIKGELPRSAALSTGEVLTGGPLRKKPTQLYDMYGCAVADKPHAQEHNSLLVVARAGFTRMEILTGTCRHTRTILTIVSLS